MKKVLLLLPLIIHIQGCGDATAKSSEQPILEPQPLFEILHESRSNEYGDHTEKTVAIIRTQEHYDAALLERSSEAPKTINFEEQVVLLVDMGVRPTGGFDIALQSLEKDGEYFHATVKLTLAYNCGTTVITNPFKIYVVNVTDEILISEVAEKQQCE